MTDKTPHQLNTRRLLCPLPVIRTQEKIKELQAGDILEVTCTDPGALHDIPAWCRVHGHSITDTRQDDLDIIITIRVEE